MGKGEKDVLSSYYESGIVYTLLHLESQNSYEVGILHIADEESKS